MANRGLVLFLLASVTAGCTAFQFQVPSAPSAVQWRVSEEVAPQTCGKFLLAGVTCIGRYCDDIQLTCGITSYELDDVRWTPYISEEGRSTSATCASNGVIVGFACSGDYCDNVAAECVVLEEFAPDGQCEWTQRISEETGFQSFDGRVAVAMRCEGDYCDDKYFRLCGLRSIAGGDLPLRGLDS